MWSPEGRGWSGGAGGDQQREDNGGWRRKESLTVLGAGSHVEVDLLAVDVEQAHQEFLGQQR